MKLISYIVDKTTNATRSVTVRRAMSTNPAVKSDD